MRTTLCDLLGIDVPIIQAGMSVFTSAELVAAVSQAGGLGVLGCWRRPVENLPSQIEMIREVTDRPFAINHVVPDLSEEAFSITLEARPAVVSLALGAPGDLVKQSHDAGSLVTHQVTTVEQAVEAAEAGVDVVFAQGSEAGGYGGDVALMPLLPQVVDAVAPVPVVASGGIADGRGLAAALMLGASGVSLGTRFLASAEATIAPEWKQLIAEARSEEAIKFDALNDFSPVPGVLGYGTTLRALRTEFIDTWNADRAGARSRASEIEAELIDAVRSGRGYELMPGAGQSAGMIDGVATVQEIMDDIMRVAEETISRFAGQAR